MTGLQALLGLPALSGLPITALLGPALPAAALAVLNGDAGSNALYGGSAFNKFEVGASVRGGSARGAGAGAAARGASGARATMAWRAR